MPASDKLLATERPLTSKPAPEVILTLAVPNGEEVITLELMTESEAAFTIPAAIVRPPLKLFAPPRSSVPDPVLVSAPVSAIMPV